MDTKGKGDQARWQSQSAAMGMGAALCEGDECCRNRVDAGAQEGKEGCGRAVGRRGGRAAGAGRTREVSRTAPGGSGGAWWARRVRVVGMRGVGDKNITFFAKNTP
jgi:hypothetical protein